MRIEVTIRREEARDRTPARRLHDEAFERPDGAAHAVETLLLDALRADADVIAELTYVALAGRDLVGHVVCSRATLDGREVVAVGPVAVRPDLQHRGIGSALMEEVVRGANRRRKRAVVLLGDPAFYGRFGFEPASAHGITALQPWNEAFQVRPVRGWDPEQVGLFRYAPAFERL